MKPRPITGPSPSEFNARITLEYPVTVPDSMGGFTTTWAIAATVWAIINEYQSDEMVIAMQSTGVLVKKIRIRYRTDIQSHWRIGHGNRYLTIIGPPVNVAQNSRWLDIKARDAA